MTPNHGSRGFTTRTTGACWRTRSRKRLTKALENGPAAASRPAHAQAAPEAAR